MKKEKANRVLDVSISNDIVSIHLDLNSVDCVKGILEFYASSSYITEDPATLNPADYHIWETENVAQHLYEKISMFLKFDKEYKSHKVKNVALLKEL